MIAILSLRYQINPKKLLKYDYGELQFMYASVIYDMELQAKRFNKMASARRKQGSRTKVPQAQKQTSSEGIGRGKTDVGLIKSLLGK